MGNSLKDDVQAKLSILAKGVEKSLYMPDDVFMENMKTSNLGGDDIEKYRYWEWPQGVGLFGLWKLYSATKNPNLLKVLEHFYQRQLAIGLPSRNVNTTAPMLAWAFLYEHTGAPEYREACLAWATWIMEEFPRTAEGGLQHITSDGVNEQELWDDTLYMTVLFLAKAGRLFGRQDFVQEAEYQFLLHAKYLLDRETGLWYHGWSFLQNNHFAAALWGRGNCWVTAGIPEYLQIANPPESVRRYLAGLLERQAGALARFQDEGGMWHTLLNDPDSYLETSATCGFGYGLLMGVRLGLLAPEYSTCALKALRPVLNCIDEGGIVQKVSYGTPMGRESRDFYKKIPICPMPYGQALAMNYLLEVVQAEAALEDICK